MGRGRKKSGGNADKRVRKRKKGERKERNPAEIKGKRRTSIRRCTV